MGNVLVGVDNSGSYRIYITDTTELVQEAMTIHQATPLAAAGLGRVLTGTGFMSVMLKRPQDRCTVLFKGDGPAKQIVAVGQGDGKVKGYIANPDVELPLTQQGKLDVGGSLGIGELTVIKDLGLKEPYSGTIALVSGEIAEDLTAYYFISEQQNTSIALGVKIGKDGRVAAAGGMFIQMLPDAKEGAIEALEESITKWDPITTYVERARANKALSMEGRLELIRENIFGEMAEEYRPRTLDFKEITWHCGCSKDHMKKALMTVGKEDLTTILHEDGQAELSCQFCGSKYLITGQELEEMLASL